MPHVNNITVYIPDLRVKRRLERQAKRLGLTVSNLVSNIISVVLPTIEVTPVKKAGELGKPAPEEEGGGEGLQGQPGAPPEGGAAGEGEGGAPPEEQPPAATGGRGKKRGT